MTITDREKCYGCYACKNACPFGAIELSEDDEGFVFPIVDRPKCTNCGICKYVCPANKRISLSEPILTFAAWNNDREIRRSSSSGGIFLAFAKNIIEDGGVVFGSTLDKSFDLYIKSSEDVDVNFFSGSKYFQSKAFDCFPRIKSHLINNNKLVLFSGTPCQVAGLYSFLQKPYRNLYTIDLICGGVASRQLFLKHLHEKHYTKKLISVKFRDKTKWGWPGSGRMIYDFGSHCIDKASFLDNFVSLVRLNICLRKSCYNCQFASRKRISDLTIGDFWGIDKKFFIGEIDDGISVLLINNTHGQELVEKTGKNITLIEREVEEAVAGNLALRKPQDTNKYREMFFSNVKEGKKLKYLVLKYGAFDIIMIRLKVFLREILRCFLGKEFYNRLRSILWRKPI